MKTTTQTELFVRSFAEFLRSLLFEIAPWFIAGLLIAVPLGWLLLILRKSGMGRVGLGVLTGLATILIAIALGSVHLLLSFGEAFDSGTDRDRPVAFIALMVGFPIFMACILSKKNENEY